MVSIIVVMRKLAILIFTLIVGFPLYKNTYSILLQQHYIMSYTRKKDTVKSCHPIKEKKFGEISKFPLVFCKLPTYVLKTPVSVI